MHQAELLTHIDMAIRLYRSIHGIKGRDMTLDPSAQEIHAILFAAGLDVSLADVRRNSVIVFDLMEQEEK